MRLTEWPKVICFGDSLTQRGWSLDAGWVSAVANQLSRRCDVINRGFSGYTSRLCRLMMPHLFGDSAGGDSEHDNVGMVIIFLGANDSSMPGSKQHVPVDEFKENMSAIVDGFLNRGIERDQLVIMTPPPVVEEKYHKFCRESGNPISKFLKDMPPYVEAVRDVSKNSGIELVDVYSSMTAVEGWENFLGDGLHFSPSGAEFVALQLSPLIENRLKLWPIKMPDWKDIDHQNATSKTFDETS